MKNILKIFVALSVIFVLSSCEGNTTKEWLIYNNSTQTIYVTGTDNIRSVSIDESIPSGETKVILTFNQLGGTDQHQNPASSLNDLVIVNENNDSLRKDYALENNWDIIIEEKSAVPSDYLHTYQFSLNERDF